VESDLQRFRRLKKEGYKLTEIRISFNKERKPSEVVDLTLKKERKEIVISSSESELFSYAIHLHSIPHIDDDDSDFFYVEDTNRYFETQKEIVDLLSGQTKEFIIYERAMQSYQKEFRKIMSFERNWILAEKDIGMLGTKLCQIFYDIGVLFLRGKEYKFEVLSKEKITFGDIDALLAESQKADLAICFSAVAIGPKVQLKKKEMSDAIVCLLVYDLKNRQTLSFNLNSLGQFQRRISAVGRHGLWECVLDLFERTKSEDMFRSYLPLPINLRDYTPLPWFCLAFIKGIREEMLVNDVKFDLPLFLAFGAPLFFDAKPSYDFDAEKQRALIMLGFKENGQRFFHQVRFDMSKGEPKLHVDYQIFSERGPPYKSVGHSIMNYKDVWDFSENLAIGFLLAATYDVNFEKLVVPTRLSGIDEAFRDNPLTIYPLFVRSMAGKPYRLVKGDSKLLNTLLKIAKRETVVDQEAVKTLADLGLAKDCGLTILGDIVQARILQAGKKQE